MDVSAVRRLCHATRQLPDSLSDITPPVLEVIESTLREDKHLRDYIAALNVDNLEERMIDFSRDDNVVYCLEDLLHTLGKSLGGSFRFGGHVTRIGSCIDGSKVGRVNELDCLYVITADIRTEPSGKNFKILVDGTAINPSELVEQFADSVDEIASRWFDSAKKSHNEKLQKFPYNFVGVRYNGPAVTMVFSPTTENQSFISLDLTTAFSLPDDLHSTIKNDVLKKLSLVQKQNPQTLFKSHGLHLVPNVVDDDWFLSTAELEAELLRSLQETTPLKRAFNSAKIISHDLAKINENGLTNDVLNSLNGNHGIPPGEYLNVSRHLAEWEKNRARQMRNIHALMSKEHASMFNEMEKSHVSINTAALKHILLAEALSNPGAFSDTVDDSAVHELVLTAYYRIATVDNFRIPHAFLPCKIGTLSVCGYEVLSGNAQVLLGTAQQECKLLHNKMKPKQIEDSDEDKAAYLDQYIVSDAQLSYPEYMYDLDTDFSVSPSRNPQVAYTLRIINALLNTCGGIVDMRGSDPVGLTDKSADKWRSAFIHSVKDSMPDNCADLILIENFSRASESLHLRVLVKPSSKLIVYKVLDQKQVSYFMDDAGHILVKHADKSVTGRTRSSRPAEEKSSADQVSKTSTDQAIDRYLEQTTNVSWISHTKSWKLRIKYTGGKTPLPELLRRCEMLRLTTPANVTPPISLYWLPAELKESLSHQSSCCALRSESWEKCLPGCGESTRLKHHFGDIFTLCSNIKKHMGLIKISGSDLGEEEQQRWWTSLRVAGRLTKKAILDQLRRWDMLHHFSLCCQIFNGSRGVIPNNEPQHDLPSWYSECQECLTDSGDSCKELEIMRIGLGMALLGKDSNLEVCLNDSLLMQLTYEQGWKVIEAESKFNWIEGPPGSGKTIIALYLCDQFGAENCLYLCSTHALSAYIEYKRKSKTYVVEEGHALSSFLKTHKLKKCIIVDDAQNMRCNKQEWMTLLEAVAKDDDVNLYVFIDCDYQNFRYEQDSKTLKTWFNEFCAEHEQRPYVLPLNKIHRNSRKVASFLAASIAEHSTNVHLTCANQEDGDDIEIMKMPKLFSPDANNSLIPYLDTLTSTYTVNHIAILVDGTESKQKVRMIREAISKNTRMQAHGADIYPRRGVTVDTLDNFVGLDAQLCIFIFSEVLRGGSESPVEGRSFSNPKYKTFIASRAIHKMVFMTESTLDHRVARAMHLTEFPEAPTGTGNTQSKTKVHPTVYENSPKTSFRNPSLKASVFDLNTVVEEWAWQKYELTADGKQKKLRQKNLLKLGIDWFSCAYFHDTQWNTIRDMPSTRRILFYTDFTNDTAMQQSYTLNVQRTTDAVCDIELETLCATPDGAGVMMRLPSEVSEDNVGFERSIRVHNRAGQTIEKELVWSAHSEIYVAPMHSTRAELQVTEKHSAYEFDVNTALSGMVKATFTDERSDTFVKAVEVDVGHVVRDYIKRMGRLGSDFSFVKVDGDQVHVSTRGRCRFSYGVKQDVLLKQSSLQSIAQEGPSFFSKSMRVCF